MWLFRSYSLGFSFNYCYSQIINIYSQKSNNNKKEKKIFFINNILFLFLRF